MKPILEIPPQTNDNGQCITSGITMKMYLDGTFDIEPATDGSIAVTARELAMMAEAALSAERVVQ